MSTASKGHEETASAGSLSKLGKNKRVEKGDEDEIPSEDGTVTAVNCNYSIAVRTSAIDTAETIAFVFVQLVDDVGNKTDRVKLKCSLTHRKKYQKGHSDLFLLVDQPSLGRLKSIEIMHIRKETADADNQLWHLHSIMVIEHETFMLYRFPCGQWIGNPDNSRTPSSITLNAEGEPYPIVPVDLSQTFE